MLLTIYYVTIQKTMSPRNSEEDVMINFVRSSRSQMFFKINVLKKLCKFHRKKPVLQSLLNKVAGLKVWNFIKVAFRVTSDTIKDKKQFPFIILAKNLKLIPCRVIKGT